MDSFGIHSIAQNRRHSTVFFSSTERTMMRSISRFARIVILLVGLSIGFWSYWEFVLRRPVARDDAGGLWIAALKGFEGTVTYIGDSDGFSFFKTGNDHTPQYKRKINDVQLPHRFAIGQESGYRVHFSMVPNCFFYGSEPSKHVGPTGLEP